MRGSRKVRRNIGAAVIATGLVAGIAVAVMPASAAVRNPGKLLICVTEDIEGAAAILPDRGGMFLSAIPGGACNTFNLPGSNRNERVDMLELVNRIPQYIQPMNYDNVSGTALQVQRQDGRVIVSDVP